MTERKAIPWRMKIDALLVRGFFTCRICGKQIKPGDELDFDHIHELADGGKHEADNLRPLHRVCHRKKSAKSVTHRFHIKRLAKGPKKAKRSLGKSRSFDKTKTRHFDGEVTKRDFLPPRRYEP